MLKNLKLSAKISLGFGALIVLITALGLIGTFFMNGARDGATVMANDQIPQVGIVSDAQRDTLFMMYNVRGYFYSDQDQFFDLAKNYKTALEETFANGIKHASDYKQAEFEKEITNLKDKTASYFNVATNLYTKGTEIIKARDGMTQAATAFLNQVDYLLKDQQGKLEEEIAQSSTESAGASHVEALKERAKKIQIINDMTIQGNAMRRIFFQAFTMRDGAILDGCTEQITGIYEKLDQLRPITRDQKNLDMIEGCRKAASEYNDGIVKIKALWQERSLMAQDLVRSGLELTEVANKVAQEGMKDTTDRANESASSLTTASQMMVTGLITGIILGITLAIVITRSITKPIQRIINGLAEGAAQVTSASSQVSMASQSLAEGATEQAAGLEETSSSLQEMSSMTQQNANNATEASTLGTATRDASEQGNEAMKRMDAAINEIQQSADETAKIIKVIDEIAFQTNLLALNAAVEAARAGEAGKGFAVVAEEVRNLAMRSAEAAKNTAAMIEESVKNAKNGVTIAGEVSQKLAAITDAATKVNNLVAEIAHSSKEQAEGINQINTAVSQIDQVTQQNAANAEESASASEELNAQAEQMNQMVNELVQMVAGHNAQTLQSSLKSAASPRKLTQTDQAFHHIASTQSKTTEKVNPKKVIPLGSDASSDDFGDFNR